MGQIATQHAQPPAKPAAARHAPLILTLTLAEPAQGLFQHLRDRHFPPERNLVPAHVSLFHALPGDARADIVDRLQALRDRGLAERPPVRVSGPFPLGRGVAFRLQAPALETLRDALARDFSDWLTPQDRQRYRPHVTIQNKVEPALAKALLSRLARGFVPFDTEGVALRLWRYMDGPWEALHRLPLDPAGPGRP